MTRKAREIANRSFLGCIQRIGGPDRDRTGDLHLAEVALSQLSYGPTNSLEIESEAVILSARQEVLQTRGPHPGTYRTPMRIVDRCGS